jgi:hypothetical protein
MPTVRDVVSGITIRDTVRWLDFAKRIPGTSKTGAFERSIMMKIQPLKYNDFTCSRTAGAKPDSFGT